jgi:hypothetical protein
MDRFATLLVAERAISTALALVEYAHEILGTLSLVSRVLPDRPPAEALSETNGLLP